MAVEKIEVNPTPQIQPQIKTQKTDKAKDVFANDEKHVKEWIMYGAGLAAIVIGGIYMTRGKNISKVVKNEDSLPAPQTVKNYLFDTSFIDEFLKKAKLVKDEETIISDVRHKHYMDDAGNILKISNDKTSSILERDGISVQTVNVTGKSSKAHSLRKITSEDGMFSIENHDKFIFYEFALPSKKFKEHKGGFIVDRETGRVMAKRTKFYDSSNVQIDIPQEIIEKADINKLSTDSGFFRKFITDLGDSLDKLKLNYYFNEFAKKSGKSVAEIETLYHCDGMDNIMCHQNAIKASFSELGPLFDIFKQKTDFWPKRIAESAPSRLFIMERILGTNPDLANAKEISVIEDLVPMKKFIPDCPRIEKGLFVGKKEFSVQDILSNKIGIEDIETYFVSNYEGSIMKYATPEISYTYKNNSGFDTVTSLSGHNCLEVTTCDGSKHLSVSNGNSSKRLLSINEKGIVECDDPDLTDNKGLQKFFNDYKFKALSSEELKETVNTILSFFKS